MREGGGVVNAGVNQKVCVVVGARGTTPVLFILSELGGSYGISSLRDPLTNRPPHGKALLGGGRNQIKNMFMRKTMRG